MNRDLCRKVIDRSSLYLDGLLSPSDRQVMERHLQTCPECAREIRAMRDLGRRVFRLSGSDAVLRRELAGPQVRRLSVVLLICLLLGGAYQLGHWHGAGETADTTRATPLKRLPGPPSDLVEAPMDERESTAIPVVDIDGGRDFLQGVFDRMGLVDEGAVIEQSVVEEIDADGGITRRIVIKIR